MAIDRDAMAGGEPGAAAQAHARDPQADPEADPEAVARAIVLRQLTGAPRSRAELEQALRRRNVPSEAATAVLDRFEELGYVDDAAYAEGLVRARHGERGLARRGLHAELRRRGVAPDLAADAVAQISPEDEEAAARRLVAKRLPALAGLPRETQLRRLVGLLGRKGYSSGLALRVAREAVAGSSGPGEEPAVEAED